MRTWALLAEKGGVGKSLLAVHLAVCATRRGKTVALIDLDAQKNADGWAALRKSKDVTVVTARAQELPGLLERARQQGADLVILDTPGRADISTAHVLDVVDVVLVPVRPFAFDVHASEKIAAEINAKIASEKRRGRVIHAAFVLNSVPPRGTRQQEARAVLTPLLPVAPVEVHYYMALCDALNDGSSVEEFDPKGNAAHEIRALYRWLAKM